MDSIRRKSDFIYKAALFAMLLFIPLIFLFLWKEHLTTSSEIDSTKFGTFGDFIGGVLGSIWSLCGVLLFYNALKEQREDFKTNKEALTKQVEALTLQSDEFKLQREELGLSRTVFQEQAYILRQQRLETLFFSLLDLYSKIKSDLDKTSKLNDYFASFKEDLFNDFVTDENCKKCFTNAITKYEEIYFTRKEKLSQYFKLAYRIIKIIDESEIKQEEKFKYIKIFRSQLSENEMLAIYYNSHSKVSGQLYLFILRYNLLKHLPSISKLEFQKYLYSQVTSDSEAQNIPKFSYSKNARLVEFNDEIFFFIQNFLQQLKVEINTDEFEEYVVSSHLKSDSNLILSLKASEENEIDIGITNADFSEIETILDFNKSYFIDYFKSYLLDIFITSQYVDYDDNVKKFVVYEDENMISGVIKSKKKLTLNKDLE